MKINFKKNNFNNKNKVLLFVLTLVMFLGVSLASIYFMYYYKDNNVNSLVSSMISVKYTENSETVNLENLVPVIDPIGEENTAYIFTVKNTSNIPVDVDINIDVDSNNTSINIGAIRYSFYINDKRVKRDNLRQDNLKVYTYEGLGVNETINCKIVFWVDYYYDIAGETFAGKINVEARNTDQIYKEATFLPGPEFNVKIKELAGNQNATYSTEDRNIISIKRASELPQNITLTNDNILSTSNSEEVIYGWYDNGTIWYYTKYVKAYFNPDSSYMFNSLLSIQEIDLKTIDTSKSTDMSYLFHNCLGLTELDVSNFNTSKVTTMAYIFAGDITNLYRGKDYRMNLQGIKGLTSFNTSEVIDMNHMFYMDINLTILDVSSFDTSKVKDMNHMFGGNWYDIKYPPKLTEIIGIENFETGNVENFREMFYCCEYLVELDVSSWDTSSAIDMSGMFTYNSKLSKIDVSNFNTDKVTDMSGMFWGCSKLSSLDLSGFNMIKVNNINNMLHVMSSLQELKTPKVYPSNLTITLYKTLYDENGNAYTSLESTSPTETWLKVLW